MAYQTRIIAFVNMQHIVEVKYMAQIVDILTKFVSCYVVANELTENTCVIRRLFIAIVPMFLKVFNGEIKFKQRD